MNKKVNQNRSSHLEAFDNQLEKLCEKFIKKNNLRPIDIVERLEFWKTEYLADLFYEQADIRNMKSELDRLNKRLQDLEKIMPQTKEKTKPAARA